MKKHTIMQSVFAAMMILLSCPTYAQIQTSGDIQVSEISASEYKDAYGRKLQQSAYVRKGKKLARLMKAYCDEFGDSLSAYGYDSLEDKIGYEELLFDKDKRAQYLLTVQYPIQSYAYIYNDYYDRGRGGDAMWGGGVVDGCLYAAEKGFDSDEYVHLRFYNLYNPGTPYAEVKEESFDYFIPWSDDIDGFFFDESHNFYFTMMKKWEGPSKYYKVNTTKIRDPKAILVDSLDADSMLFCTATYSVKAFCENPPGYDADSLVVFRIVHNRYFTGVIFPKEKGIGAYGVSPTRYTLSAYEVSQVEQVIMHNMDNINQLLRHRPNFRLEDWQIPTLSYNDMREFFRQYIGYKVKNGDIIVVMNFVRNHTGNYLLEEMRYATDADESYDYFWLDINLTKKEVMLPRGLVY